VAAAAERQRVFLRSVAVVGVSVFLSRVLGFFREWAIAHQVGATGVTDAYYAAFTIPDILNYLLAGGALSITFIPVFLEYFATERKEEAWAVFSTVLTVMTAALLVLLVIAEIYAETFTAWIAPGFGLEQRETVTYLTRIMLPAQAFFFLGGVLSAVQYAQGRFLVPSLAPLIYNGLIIAAGMLLARRIGIQAFSWGVQPPLATSSSSTRRKTGSSAACSGVRSKGGRPSRRKCTGSKKWRKGWAAIMNPPTPSMTLRSSLALRMPGT